MSSIESLVLDLESEYSLVLKNFDSVYRDLRDSNLTSDPFSDLESTLKSVINFQHKIEQSINYILPLAQKTSYPKRAESYGQAILARIAGEIVDQVTVYEGMSYIGNRLSVNAFDVIQTLELTKKCLSDLRFAQLYCQAACEVFKNIRTDLIQFELEMRHIGALTIFPIDQKAGLKTRLSLNDLAEVRVSLEQAESSFTEGINDEGKRKNCISRSRDAIELFVATLRERVVQEKTERSFHGDNVRLMKAEFYDNHIMQFLQGVYALCSTDKGSHKFGPQEITIIDAEEALRETYTAVNILLRYYLLWNKNNGQKSV